jgi:hypothetical protein
MKKSSLKVKSDKAAQDLAIYNLLAVVVIGGLFWIVLTPGTEPVSVMSTFVLIMYTIALLVVLNDRQEARFRYVSARAEYQASLIYGPTSV